MARILEALQPGLEAGIAELMGSAKPDPADIKASGAKPNKRPRKAQGGGAVDGTGGTSTSKRAGSD
jgi:hypothetical protein